MLPLHSYTVSFDPDRDYLHPIPTEEEYSIILCSRIRIGMTDLIFNFQLSTNYIYEKDFILLMTFAALLACKRTAAKRIQAALMPP